jgi:hypothetical protein
VEDPRFSKKKGGRSHVNANSFSHSGCHFLRLIYSTYFILKNLAAKDVGVSLSKPATEAVCLLIFKVKSLRSTVQFIKNSNPVKQHSKKYATLQPF